MAKEIKPDFEHPQPQTTQPAVGQVFQAVPDTTALATQIQQLQRRIEAIENKRINFNTDIIGLFETITAAPTQTPTSPYEQIKIALIAGTYYLYVYNNNNMTWKRVALS